MAEQAPLLVVGPAWVGDMVMAQTLFRILRQQRPEREIDVLAPAWSLPLLARMPEVRRGLVLDTAHGELGLRKRYQLGMELRRQRYGQAILLPNSLKSALVPFFAQIPVRTGWRGEMRFILLNDIRLLIKRRYPLMIQRFAALAFKPNADLPADLPRPRLQIDAAAAQSLSEEFGLAGAPFLALCPGAEFGPAKRWPSAHFATLAQQWLDRGWRVALFGSANDKPVTAEIAGLLQAGAEQVVDLAGRTSLEQAVDLMSRAGGVVANDSGLMHIAAALERPLAVVYGSTSPGFTPPLSDTVTVHQLEVDCGPCFERECPLGHMKCLQQLAPQPVAAALHQLIEEKAADPA